MKHFVSASCGGEICSICHVPATHKVGEEIMHDEPCMLCGTTWRFWQDKNDQGTRVLGTAKNDCKGAFHLFGGPSAQRHNLTAYVCCKHFTMILGPATGCPIEPDGGNDGVQQGQGTLLAESTDQNPGGNNDG